MTTWVGKIAIVTGAAAGMGRAIAEILVKNGLQVIAVDKNKENIENLANMLDGEQGKLIPHELNLLETHQIIKSFNWIEKNVGPISVLVNNAGVIGKTSIIKGNIDYWRKTMDTNFFALAVATRQALESMENNQINGYVVNINSIAGYGQTNFPDLNVYVASKHAVTAFTETLRRELATKKSKIRITSISPGMVITDMHEPSAIKEITEKFPHLSPEDIAHAVWSVLETPPHMNIAEMIVRPTGELF